MCHIDPRLKLKFALTCLPDTVFLCLMRLKDRPLNTPLIFFQFEEAVEESSHNQRLITPHVNLDAWLSRKDVMFPQTTRLKGRCCTCTENIRYLLGLGKIYQILAFSLDFFICNLSSHFRNTYFKCYIWCLITPLLKCRIIHFTACSHL